MKRTVKKSRMTTKKKPAAKPVNIDPAKHTVFSTGAYRDSDKDKIDFEGHLSPFALDLHGRYMHKHRYGRHHPGLGQLAAWVRRRLVPEVRDAPLHGGLAHHARLAGRGIPGGRARRSTVQRERPGSPVREGQNRGCGESGRRREAGGIDPAGSFCHHWVRLQGTRSLIGDGCPFVCAPGPSPAAAGRWKIIHSGVKIFICDGTGGKSRRRSSPVRTPPRLDALSATSSYFQFVSWEAKPRSRP